MIERCYLELMPYVCGIKKLIGRPPIGGDPVYGEPTYFNCQIQDELKLIRSLDGQESIAHHKLFIYGAPKIKVDDILILPDGSTPPILATELWSDEKGAHHTVVRYR